MGGGAPTLGSNTYIQVNAGSDPLCVVKDANRWEMLKILKLQRLFEPGRRSKQCKQVGGTEDRKATNAVVDPACLL
jgi:hypothetical protein